MAIYNLIIYSPKKLFFGTTASIIKLLLLSFFNIMILQIYIASRSLVSHFDLQTTFLDSCVDLIDFSADNVICFPTIKTAVSIQLRSLASM